MSAEEKVEVAMAHVLSVINQKGGVGKTTTVIHLSSALARLGHQVLVVDMDPQANVSAALGLRYPHEIMWTTAKLLSDTKGYIPLTPWHETIEKNVSLIYGHISLTKVERQLTSAGMPQFRLRNQLQRMAIGERIVLIDCPPSLSLLTVNSLVAADSYLVPLESGSTFSMDGYEDLEELVEEVRTVNSSLRMLGILINQYDGRKTIHREMFEAVSARFGELVLKPTIKFTAKIEEAPAVKKSIFQHDRKSPSAADFMDLGREILRRLGIETIAIEADVEPRGDDGDGGLQAE
jgi:chromosome partitioning protein